MHAGHEEAARNKIEHAAIADHRDIEVAGAGTVGVERRAVVPSLAGHRTAANNHHRPGRYKLFEDATKGVVALRFATKRQPNHIVPLRFFLKPALNRLIAR